ncbi:hypothetical protein [Flavobacterium sp.]|uniref:hypothetical protein n=1 Tax=Flavobacterium sp. TaxID=239 RepID=UPI0037BED0E0
MKNKRFDLIFNFILLITLFSCNDSEETDYILVEKTPVILNLENVPYPKLSDYKFFQGSIKDQNPSYGVIPYEPTSELFTDYAEKNRFLWMPEGTKASYSSDSESLNLPIGAALIKTFYYNNVQPSNTTKIIETRVMIRKSTGWIFAEYVWNDEQTEATLQNSGSSIPISWKDINSIIQTIDYQIPDLNQCLTCHSNNQVVTPIGIKPQSLNSNFSYADGTKNQLQKLIDFGYLENNLPSNIVSVVNYNDTSKSLDLRVRSYFDINCAHCHQDGGNAAYVPQLRLSFNETANLAKMGVCVSALTEFPGFPRGKLVNPGNIAESYIYFSMNTDLSLNRMPRIGRTIVHQEGIQLVEQWINSLPACE